MQIKTTVAYHYIPIKMAKIKKTGHTKVGEKRKNRNSNKLLVRIKNGITI